MHSKSVELNCKLNVYEKMFRYRGMTIKNSFNFQIDGIPYHKIHLLIYLKT
jgi:hypothetical protein